jgi:Mn-dependent DtxR family transcriptional regulator
MKMGDWTFFSNYGHVLVCLSRDKRVRLRDVAFDVGITERAVQKIVRDMQDAGFITVSKQGRCNRYRLNKRKSLRHHLESHCNVGKLLALVTRPDPVQAAAEKLDDADAVAREAVSHARAKQAHKPTTSVSAPAQQSKANVSGVRKKADNKPVDSCQQGSLF